MSTIIVNVEISVCQALAFSDYLKRQGFSEYRAASTSEIEARVMQSAGEEFREAIAKAGVVTA